MKLVIRNITALILCFCCFMGVIVAGRSAAVTPSSEAGKTLRVRPYDIGRCMTAINPQERDKGVVIHDEQTLKSQHWNSPECRTNTATQIDFARWMLVGREFVIPGGCSSGGNAFAVSVTQDDRRRTYTHTVTSGIGPCAGQSNHQIWLLVPKLPSGYRIEFQRLKQPGLLITCGYDDI